MERNDDRDATHSALLPDGRSASALKESRTLRRKRDGGSRFDRLNHIRNRGPVVDFDEPLP
jgi:hypothetical protein